MSFNQMGYPGQAPSTRVAQFLQNPGQSVVSQVYGTMLELGLAPAQSVLIPEGQWIAFSGPYSDLQFFDQSQQRWLGYSALDAAPLPVSSDGTNFRFVNSSGTPVGAIVTNAGTTLGSTYPTTMWTPNGYWQGGTFTAAASPALTCTASSGGSTWNTFIGGAINTTIAITAGGASYTVAPKIVIVPPANQGSQPFIPATAICTISAGAINAVTVTNQGAGYVGAPTVLVLNQPGDTTGAGAVLTPAITGTGQLTAVINNTQGTVLTAVVTLTIAGASAPASAAASPVHNFSLTNTGAGTVTAGSGYTNGYSLLTTGGIATATPIYTNPAIEKGLTTPTQPYIYSASTTIVGLNNAASINAFYGTGYQVVPLTLNPSGGVGSATPGAIVGPTVGGQNDVCLLYPI
jgi:hypothetical protein